MTDYVSILTIVVGDGVLLAVLTLLFNWFTQKSGTRIEARKDARDFYMGLFGRIVYIEDLLNAYFSCQGSCQGISSSVPPPLGKVFIKKRGYIELPPEDIKSHFKNAYGDFLNYYTQKRCEGFGIFVSKKLRKHLLAFQNILTSDDTINANKSVATETMAHLIDKPIDPNKAGPTQVVARQISDTMDENKLRKAQVVAQQIRKSIESLYGLR